MTLQQRIISPEKALARLEELCVKAERCESELAEKLRAWGIGTSDASKILASLREQRFVDDSRYATAFVRDKYRFARWGKRKIALALRQKRISADIISIAIEQIDFDEYLHGLEHILNAKRRTLTDADTYEGRTKLFRFAASRGFEPDLIAKVLRHRDAEEP